MCMCLTRGQEVLGGERIGFGLYQFWRNMGKVGYVSVVWLWWCWWGVGGRIGLGSGRVGLCLCVL